MEMSRVACVAGARPNFVKIAPIISALRARPCFTPVLIHTGQHCSREMSENFFRELEIPEPDFNLGIGGGTHATQTAQIMLRLEPILLDSRPDLVLVVGDVNSTLAAALVAAKIGIPVAHVEAGLRSFDRTMPEEINRLVTDAISDFLFTSEPGGERNLLAEGVSPKKIFFVGNVMIDTLLRFREKAAQSRILDTLNVEPRAYAAVTLHRPANVDTPQRLRELLAMLACLRRELPVVFPVHPRTRDRILSAGLAAGGVTLTEPLGYLDFIKLVSEARMVLTDSGGIQEEATVLRVPCLTLRDNTERPVTLDQGTNRLVGTNPAGVLKAALETLHAAAPHRELPRFWDGHAAARIADVLQERLRENPTNG